MQIQGTIGLGVFEGAVVGAPVFSRTLADLINLSMINQYVYCADAVETGENLSSAKDIKSETPE